jgi:hypothetical protein
MPRLRSSGTWIGAGLCPMIAVAVMISCGCCVNRCIVGDACDVGNPALCGSECESCSLGDNFPGGCGRTIMGCRGGLSGLALPLLSTRLACGSGCGDVYWNEWMCDPPECCDPCDEYGCWVGPQTCPGRPCILGSALYGLGSRLRHGFGWVFGSRSCACCGVDDCIGSGSCCDGQVGDVGCPCGQAGCTGESCGGAPVVTEGVEEAPIEPGGPAPADPPFRQAMRATGVKYSTATGQLRQQRGRSPSRVISRRIR